MTDEARALMASSPLAWIDLNKMKTENQQPIEFHAHRFLIDLYADMHPDIVVRKSAQVGESVERIFKSLWCAKYLGANVIYVLPTNNVVKDFVAPKVNPLINSNPQIQALVSKDSESLKQVGDRFIYFKGAYSERDAIAISGDILILDELDRMPDMRVVNTYDSRLQHSKFAYRWRLSNPSAVGFGVDALYQDSDQRHWFIRHSCGHEWFIDFEPDGKCHYVDKTRLIYACGGCNGEITNEQRRMGRWIARYPNHHRHGYWISQMMAPWVSAKRIMEQYEESTLDFFYNFVLGKAYTASNLIVNRETILRACAPSTIERTPVAIGVDQNVNEQIWVAMTPQGVFAHGRTTSWEEFERLKLMYNAVVVCDPNPYPTMPKKLAEKYSDFYLCYFKESKGLEIITYKEQIVYADRTRLLDTVANEITEAKLLFREKPTELEDYIGEWGHLYRTTEEQPDGRSRSIWLKTDNKESDYPFATAYARIALANLIAASDTAFVDPIYDATTKVTHASSEDGWTDASLAQTVKDTLNSL